MAVCQAELLTGQLRGLVQHFLLLHYHTQYVCYFRALIHGGSVQPQLGVCQRLQVTFQCAAAVLHHLQRQSLRHKQSA